MQVPAEITIKDIEKTPELEEHINKKIAKLEKLCSYIISCRVSVERPQIHPETSNPHRVRIDIKLPPSHEIVAKNLSSRHNVHDPLPIIINKTFRAAERQLIKITKIQHKIVKTHLLQQTMGIVHRLFPEQGYGFIKTLDTAEDVYFNKNSVLHNDFSRIKLGTGIRFASEMGDKGLQASSVEIVEKNI
jgi:cold shock CspA family protein/ribosome-associated translation inhibitor RaiA